MGESPTGRAAATFDPIELRRVFGRFATGVTVVTTRDRSGQPKGLTANSFTSVSLNPPLVLVCLDLTVDCYEAFASSDYFGISILSASQEATSRRFATKGIEKFEGVPTNPGVSGVPLIAGAVAQIECRKVCVYPGGDHSIFLGEVIRFSADESSARPLVFFGGRYAQLT